MRMSDSQIIGSLVSGLIQGSVRLVAQTYPVGLLHTKLAVKPDTELFNNRLPGNTAAG